MKIVRLKTGPAATLVVASAAFFLLSSVSAHRTLLSGRDLVTLRQAQGLASSPGLQATPGNGLSHVVPTLSRVFLDLLGESEIAVRAPAIVAYWAMLVCVSSFVRHHASRAAAWWAVLAAAATGWYPFAYDARADAVIGALVAAALVCWQRSSGTSRAAWLTGLTGALSCAAYLQARTALVILVVVIATAMRILEQRRADLPALLAISVPAALSIVVSVPFASRAIEAAPRIWHLQLALLKLPAYAVGYLQTAYGEMLRVVGPFLLMLVTAAIFSQNQVDRKAAPRSEIFAATALALLPVWGYAPARIFGMGDTAGDMLPALIGCSIWLGWLGDTLSINRPPLRVVWTGTLLCAVAANFAFYRAAELQRSDLRRSEGRFALLRWQDRLVSDLPIVIPDFDVYLQLAHYGPPPLADRLVYIASERSTGVLPQVDIVRAAGRQGLRLTDLETFGRDRQDFYVFESSEVRSRLLKWLAEKRPEISLVQSSAPANALSAAPAYLYRMRLSK
jgi:hypothetical protein